MTDLPVLGPAPRRVETERLVMRAYEPEDEAVHHALCVSEGFWTYPFQRVPTDVEIAEIWATRLDIWDTLGWGPYVLEEKATGVVVGQGTLAWGTFLPNLMPVVDLGWRLAPEGRGKGYATEAGRACARVAFEHLGVDRCIVAIEPANTPSLRVAERLGGTEPWSERVLVRGFDVEVTLRWFLPEHLAGA